MSRIHDSTSITQHHAPRQGHMPAAKQPEDGIGTMTQDKVKEVAAAIQGLSIAGRQRALEQGQIEQKMMGSKIDTFA